MSLYNMACGNNPLFGLFARILETVAPLPMIPRFRDMYTRGNIQIVLYTRTGGGNREGYKTENEAITLHPLFVDTFDDDFDNTFAHWVFSVPEKYSEGLSKLHQLISHLPKFCEPSVKFEMSLNSLEGKVKEHKKLSDSDCELLGELLENLAKDLPEESNLEKQLKGQ